MDDAPEPEPEPEPAPEPEPEPEPTPEPMAPEENAEYDPLVEEQYAQIGRDFCALVGKARAQNDQLLKDIFGTENEEDAP